MSSIIFSAIIIAVLVNILLVIILLVVKDKITPSGTVQIDINDGKRVLDVQQGGDIMHTLAQEGIFLPSACGGKATCGQCKVQMIEGGGEILDTERGHFNRKQIKDGMRLGCQVKIKEDIKIRIPESTLSVKKLECEVISNRNVASFIKEFTVRIPDGEHLDFKSGEYIQIDVPKGTYDYKDIQVDEPYKQVWERYGFFDLKCENPEDTVRAYSMASYPAEGQIIKLNVRIATPPFDPKAPKGSNKLLPVNPGIASTYVFTRRPGDMVSISGPFGEFLLPENDPIETEYVFVGGGAGMAPLRSHIMHLFRTLKTKRKVSFFYGARSLSEAFYLEDFWAIEKDFPNFRFYLTLDRPDPVADKKGVKYSAGFVAPEMGRLYLNEHEAPEDIQYFMCGPPMMVKTVKDLLDSLGVDLETNLHFDDFG
jgi:Na+-transporting NADH:ubiquinone oxidoreductase subunit F